MMRDLKDHFTRLPAETATGPFGDPSAPGDLPQGFPSDSDGKESVCNAGDPGSIPGLGRRKWQHTPVFLPGDFHGQRNLAGYSP